jgi:hypothetical protein
MGSPPGVKPQGTEIAGTPARLAGVVYERRPKKRAPASSLLVIGTLWLAMAGAG